MGKSCHYFDDDDDDDVTICVMGKLSYSVFISFHLHSVKMVDCVCATKHTFLKIENIISLLSPRWYLGR